MRRQLEINIKYSAILSICKQINVAFLYLRVASDIARVK